MAAKKATKKKSLAKKTAAKKAPAKKAPAKKAPAKKAPAKKAPAAGHLALCSSVVVGPKRKAVLFAYRQDPDNAEDSGWRFLRGDESEDFLSDASHCLVCPLDLVFAMDGSLEKLVAAPVGSAFQRASEKATWSKVEDYDPER